MLKFQTSTTMDRAREQYEATRARFETEKKNILLAHFGYFSQDLVNGFTEGVEELLISSGEKKSLIKRVFSIMIEGLQNIRFHGEADDQGKNYGLFFLVRNDEGLVLFLGSLVNEEHRNELNNRLSKLNELKEDEVKDHYMAVLTNGEISSKGNAGLGFITMRMKSRSKLNYQFIELASDLYLFTVEIPMRNE